VLVLLQCIGTGVGIITVFIGAGVGMITVCMYRCWYDYSMYVQVLV
jgi:hypothetical protein